MKTRGMNALVFTYIFAAIVIAVLLFFGISSYMDVVTFSQAIDVKDFEKNFFKEVKDISVYAPGSATKISLRVPQGIKALCVVTQGQTPYKQVNEYKELVGETKNVFYVVQKGDPPKPFLVSQLIVKEGARCFDTSSGLVSFILTNEGDTVVLSL